MMPNRAALLRERAARLLLPVFAFSAWSLTGVAHGALFLLITLFLWDLATDPNRRRRDPALWLLAGGLVLTGVLAVRAALLFPQTASEQWHAIWVWNAPLLFPVLAWWFARDLDRIWTAMGAALLGLAFGVLHKADWSLIPEVLGGLRYEFDYATLGLAFVASAMLVGVLLFRARFTGMRVGGRARPLLGWTLWAAALVFLLFVLAVTQSRGSALSLAAAGALYALAQGLRLWGRRGRQAQHGKPSGAALVYGLLLVLLAGLFLWATKDRQIADLQSFAQAEASGHLSYEASVGARINLHRVAAAVVAERPLLGWGPGTSTTELTVAEGLVPLPDYDRNHAPRLSHLHSVALEILARFGLAGALFAAALGALLAGAYRQVLRDPRAPGDLRAFFVLVGVMTLLYCLYDFRLVNVDFRFFSILFFGMLYAFKLAPAGTPAESGGTTP